MLYKAHGLSSRPEYRIWGAIKTRCYNPNHISYPNYGGRGIKMSPEWVNNFKTFFDHVGGRPSNEHSIDRIDNSKGYVPGNLRWSTKAEQAHNRRVRAKSGLKGAYKDRTKWISRIKKDGKDYYLGSFDTAEEAHKTYLLAESRLWAIS